MVAPTRLGLVSMHKHAEEIKRLQSKYDDQQLEWLTPEQYEKVVALIQCILDFLHDVPEYPSDPPS